jgi:hypothetical protein
MIDLTEIVPPLDACQNLQKAGFPQETLFFWAGYTYSSPPYETVWEVRSKWQIPFIPKSCEIFAAPIIPELKKCDPKYLEIVRKAA